MRCIPAFFFSLHTKKTFSHVNFNGRAARIFSPIKLNRWCLRRRHRTIYNLHGNTYPTRINIWNMLCGNFLQHAFSCETITLHANYTAHCSKFIWLHARNGCNSRSQLFFFLHSILIFHIISTFFFLRAPTNNYVHARHIFRLLFSSNSALNKFWLKFKVNFMRWHSCRPQC